MILDFTQALINWVNLSDGCFDMKHSKYSIYSVMVIQSAYHIHKWRSVGNADQRQIMSVTFLRRTAQAWSLIMGTIINCWIKCNLLLGAFKMWNYFFFNSRESKTAFVYHTRGNMQFGFRRVCEILNKRDLQSSWVLFRMNLTWITKLWWLVKFVQLIFIALALVR